MYNLFMTLLIIVSILIVIVTMMQPQKQQDALNALSGGAVFSGQTKKRGFEAFMEKVTAILLVLFFAFAIVLAYLSSK
ncbi:preprotein translocase subunit SecG [Lactobacillus bombicola]|uniref:Protein-export membrane protein SecG n=1 Tax=Lactobacillus bombicola TaxID=1505723 RepID=A0A1I1T5R4_9LACO|nr:MULTISPECIES: preprotein translocase subunit SecG [Lactobacillus]MCO6527883.1 preprotein translocase subunit SecG [Lactobacillus sp.]RHW48950.1 preprotein translocase subunit SecG [Lactobacillus bombicola]RHW53659.1 preprotein translocase subunit SecG [Lactobacillus bombicola]RHW54217.1 preprotein translocase subunit SecG [Lactobacillus bombicola]RMC40645.1 preprotein translocase subunit SecG [Lactobacillus sp. ESL0237]